MSQRKTTWNSQVNQEAHKKIDSLFNVALKYLDKWSSSFPEYITKFQKINRFLHFNKHINIYVIQKTQQLNCL